MVYVAASIKPEYYTLLSASALLGIGAAIIWVAQGSMLARSSTEETIGLYSGVVRIRSCVV